MLQAVEAPVLKLAALAGVVLAVAAFATPTKHEGVVVQRLELHAPELPNAIYLTAWERGDVFVSLPEGRARSMTFKTRAYISDGCEWLATEQLVPEGKDRYWYSYEEEILSCEPGAIPAIKTPRTGYAHVVSTFTR